MHTGSEQFSFNQALKRIRSILNSENLNRIAGQIVNERKDGRIIRLRSLAAQIKPYRNIEFRTEAELFTRLLLLFHPDLLGSYLHELDEAQKKGDVMYLNSMNHIPVALSWVKELSGEIEGAGETDQYSEGSGGSEEGFAEDSSRRNGYDESDFDDVSYAYYDDNGESVDFDDETVRGDYFENEEDMVSTLFNAVRRAEYGGIELEKMDLSFRPDMLESIEGELDLSSMEINDLFGIEYLTRISTLNLSDNELDSLRGIGELSSLRELYVASNRIDSLKGLQGLESLEVLDISHNPVEDFSALYKLENLKVLVAEGVKIEKSDQTRLLKAGVIVVC